ncbi:phosphatidylserine/phosphatidylglycerophosphate/cardiolipin synthase-like enzyme [Rhizobium sp. BK181]|uniref:phospholipase D-like domain-containing protein n=1 Tax=Rhizobium sp. BK181 TaxID=2587072 RepID=UPI0017E292C7|nr:phospholipase D-like domain-containing protein [Rhizobium sp. BK181]MBB3317784.1 phosphatidylserine/phosphatidylglycerophosphate/cardiolipin synthase-like enzyme [Rhizobium sp. BK181]
MPSTFRETSEVKGKQGNMQEYRSADDAPTTRNAFQLVTAALKRPSRQTPSQQIIRPRRNAWRSGIADETTFLIDGSAYFSALDQALRKARREVWIIGWDFNPDIRLRPDVSSETLGELLLSLVDDIQQLRVRVLVWGMGPIYSGKSVRLFRRNAVSIHRQISLRFDFGHPLRACHHQKLVSIDGSLAFLGGIDLTDRRWDEPDHRVEHPLRRSTDGTPYPPVHDIQCLVSGEAALMIRDLARRRWNRATRERIVPDIEPTEAGPLLAADMVQTPAAIALTEPGMIGKRGRYQARRLTRDAIAAAKRLIYIETQYLASAGVGRSIARRLKEPNGPEIAVVVTKSSHGLIEKLAMGNNRDRLIRRLKRSDRFDRLRVMYAVVPDGTGGEQELIGHSKLIIVDDSFVRIGSSNLNNRSEGLDTECDLALEADCSDHRDSIRSLRHRLMAEHLGSSPAVVREMEQTRTMLETIAALNTGERGLRDFKVDLHRGETTPFLGTSLIDPRRPYWPLQKLRLRLGRLLNALL